MIKDNQGNWQNASGMFRQLAGAVGPVVVAPLFLQAQLTNLPQSARRNFCRLADRLKGETPTEVRIPVSPGHNLTAFHLGGGTTTPAFVIAGTGPLTYNQSAKLACEIATTFSRAEQQWAAAGNQERVVFVPTGHTAITLSR